MGRYQLLPNIKVNYSLSDIFCAFFLPSRIKKYEGFVKGFLEATLDVPGVVLTSSGRAALYFILKGLTQRKVIIPAYTCDVVVEAAALAGKNIVYAHVDMQSLNVEDVPEIDNDSIFIATHQYGFPCKIKEFCAACKEKGTIVIEDCAGALGTKIDGQMAGTFGDYAIFSFNASKLINSPATGGFLIAKNEDNLAALKESICFKPCSFKYKAKNLIKSLAFCLDKNSYVHYWLSKSMKHDANKAYIPADDYKPSKRALEDYTYGFYNWQAYVVLKQLKRLPELLKKREELTKAYQSRLDHIYQSDYFNRQNSSIRYPIYLNDREKARIKCEKLGVGVGAGFEHFVCPKDYLEEIAMAKQITYLPFSSNYSKKEIDHIINVLNKVAYE